MYNTHVIISNEGQIQAVYRKVHLFDVNVPNGPVLMESRSTAPGKEVRPNFDSQFWCFAPPKIQERS